MRAVARAGAIGLARDRAAFRRRRGRPVTMHSLQTIGARMNSVLLNYYEAIEKASQDMLEAARTGNWDQVVKLEGACAVLIAQLKNTAAEKPLPADEAQLKSRIMQRILVNDAEIRQLAEPWLEDLDDILAGRPKTLH
jgi:flagellar protein FliT